MAIIMNNPKSSNGELQKIVMHPIPATQTGQISYTNEGSTTKDVIITAFASNEYSDNVAHISYTTTGTVTEGYGMSGRMFDPSMGVDLTGVSSKSYGLGQYDNATFTCTVRLDANESVTINHDGSAIYQAMIVYTD